MIQLSILKITGYGPWTLTLGSDREHRLQMLQAALYNTTQQLFSKKDGLVFLNRSDELFAVSNGIDIKDHIEIQRFIDKEFDVGFNISIGHGDSPLVANRNAYQARQDKSLLDTTYQIYGSNTIPDTIPDTSNISIMHLDVDDLTSYRKTRSPFEISIIIFELYVKMAKYFTTKDSLTFFMGGDNFMVIASDAAIKSAKEFITMIKQEHSITLNCGIGRGNSARAAAKLATQSLDTIREIRDSGKPKPDIYEIC